MSSENFAAYASKLRNEALVTMEPQVLAPTVGLPLARVRYPWKNNIVTTLFWVGPKAASAWDGRWTKDFGGFDDPNPRARKGFLPAAFIPRRNPFYCSLPYNDIASGQTKPEARAVIPWFKDTFEREGQSVCRDRWVRIRNRENRDCYAQWSDCGPFGADHWQYVFGDERPRANANQGAGLGISPAVRDYLALASTDVTDWQFVDFKDVPRGPWSIYGENNPFVQHPPEPPAKLVPPAPTEHPAESADQSMIPK